MFILSIGKLAGLPKGGVVKAHKVELLVIDIDACGSDEVSLVIENAHYPNSCISPQVMSIASVDIDWSDEHPLNQRNTSKAEYHRLFDQASNRTPAITQPESDEQNRKEFEQWAKQECLDLTLCPQYKRYHSYPTQTAWQAWRSRKPLPLGDAGKLVEALEGLLREAVILSREYLKAFDNYGPDDTIQGWDKARWLRAADAADFARETLSTHLAGTSKGDGE
jgi:hypothetical protein